MWPFSSSKDRDRQLRELLTETKGFVDRSDDSIWVGLSSAEIAMDLCIAISKIEVGEAVGAEHLKMLFAPTGPIQELAIASGWVDDYMRLSTAFDTLIRGRI